MTNEKQDHQCIERRISYSPDKWFYSVREYEDRFLLAEIWTTDRDRHRLDLDWTDIAPRVEKLTTENVFCGPNGPHRIGFGICDLRVYEAQMREFVGLA